MSITFEKIFFKIINTIGPARSPNIPKNLKPVYIEINVYIGWIPILLLTILGSSNCFTNRVKIYNPKSEKPNALLLLAKLITDQGIITVPLPKYRKAINKANYYRH